VKTIITILAAALAATAQTPTRKTHIAPAVTVQDVAKPVETTPMKKAELSPSSTTALAVAEEWQTGDPLPAAGANGSVVYRYGAAMPPIFCVPLRLTTIVLEAGERLQSPLVMGDTLRWEYELLTAGEGPAARTTVVLKAKRPDISTDLVLATNKRTYYLQLTSRASGHLSQVEFSYPATANWLAYQQQQATAAAAQKDNTVARVDSPPNFRYTTRAKVHVAFMPKTVYDDGHQTYFKMAAEAKDWDTAVLLTSGPNGCEIVNYRANGDTWIVDRLFMSAELVSGTGRRARTVQIFRDGSGPVDCSKGKKAEPEKTAKR
jgi:type IV secretion system protein VirB9